MSAPPQRANAPRLVELVGPAGAGKSTLAASLPAQDSDVANGPSLWGLPRAMLLASALELIPTAVAAALSGHPLATSEMGQMVRIGALRRALERASRGAHGTIVIDEGAVFGLTWLEVFHAADADPSRLLWRRRQREQWARRLSAVVRLDADHDELARRIRTRTKSHMVKGRSDQEIEAFTTRFRACYDRVIGAMAACGSLAVGSMASRGGTVADEAARLRAAIRKTLGEH